MTSPLRQAQARMTQGRIMDAAAASLLEHGYAATTIAAVAERAGVAVPTVYKAFGSKTALVKRLYDRTLAGDDQAVPIGDRADARAILTETDPAAVIGGYARLAAEMSARLSPLLAVLLAARSADPALAGFVDAIEAERRAGNLTFATHLASLGAVPSPERAADVLWLFTAPEVHLRLVQQRGWSPSTFAEWLETTLRQQLLGP